MLSKIAISKDYRGYSCSSNLIHIIVGILRASDVRMIKFLILLDLSILFSIDLGNSSVQLFPEHLSGCFQLIFYGKEDWSKNRSLWNICTDFFTAGKVVLSVDCAFCFPNS